MPLPTPKVSGEQVSHTELNLLAKIGYIVDVLSGETIDGTPTPKPVYIQKVDAIGNLVDQNDVSFAEIQNIENQAYSVYGANWQAQLIAVPSGIDRLSGIMLAAIRPNGSPGNIIVELFAKDGSNNPTGAALASATIGATTWPLTGIEKHFVQFATPATVTGGTTYFLQIKASGGDTNNYIQFYKGSNYTGGFRRFSSDSGASWTSDGSSEDIYFQLFGYTSRTAARAFLCDANDLQRVFFDGFAISDGTAGSSLIIQREGIVAGFSSLTVGADYYVQDDGSLGTVRGTYEVYVGRAISATQIEILKRQDQLKWKAFGSDQTGKMKFFVPFWARKMIIDIELHSVSQSKAGRTTMVIFRRQSGHTQYIDIGQYPSAGNISVAQIQADIGGFSGSPAVLELIGGVGTNGFVANVYYFG